MSATLFERYGGFAAVSKIVMAFYERLLDDDQVGPYFEDVDLPRLMDHQTKFISTLMGGPASFSDEHLRRVHAQYRISAADFERTNDILASVLLDCGMDEDDVERVMSEFGRRAPSIVDPAGDA